MFKPRSFIFLVFGCYILGGFGSNRSEAETEISIFGAYRAENDSPVTFKEEKLADYEGQLYGQEPSYVIGRTPSVTLYSDSGLYQGYSYLRLRGIDQTRINMTLDGVPLNEPEDQGAYFSNYPDFLNSVRSFQVIRGVGTSQNGTASYGGSMLFESPSLFSPPGSQVGASGGSYGSARVFAQYSGTISENQGLYLRAAELRSDGYKHNSGNDGQSLFYKWGTLDRLNQWSISGFLGHQANELSYIGSTKEDLARDRRHNGNTNEDDNFVQSLTQIQNIRSFSSGDVLSSTMYYTHLQGNYDFDLNNFLGQSSTSEMFNYHLDSNFVGAFSTYRTNFAMSQLTFGLHTNWYERKHIGSERTLGGLYENTGTKTELSSFAKYEQTVGDVLFLADMQVRHTTFDYSGTVPLQNLDWTFFNPKAGVTWLYTNWTNFYYSIGRTGREPTRNDMFLGNDNLAADEQGNPMLGPTGAEHVVDQELGVRTKGEQWNLQANLFYLDFDNEIVLNGELGPTALPLTDSVDQSYRAGLELDFQWSVSPHFSIESNASWMHSQIRESGTSFAPVITPDFVANQALEYRWGRAKVRTDMRYQSSSYIDFANSSSIEGFFVTDLSAHYDLAPVDLGVHVNNLFNERCYSNGYMDFNGEARYFVQAPTNFFVTVTWKF